VLWGVLSVAFTGGTPLTRPFRPRDLSERLVNRVWAGRLTWLGVSNLPENCQSFFLVSVGERTYIIWRWS
jgi:hypothetical protein